MFDKCSLMQRLKELPFSEKEYWVVAGGAMVLHGFRPQTHDIDLDCSARLADELEQQGHAVSRCEDGTRKILYSEDIEIFENWIEGTVETIDGIPVVCVDGLIRMKRNLGREKDLADIELIEKKLSEKARGTYAAKPPMVILSGPTAVGKTKLSIALAKAIGGEIISADSCQVYRHMDIGSAKITEEEMQGIPHHMIDILDPWEDFSVAVFKEKCEQCLPGIYARGHIPIVTGGTGFYVQALLRDIDFGSGEERSCPTGICPTEDNENVCSDTGGMPSEGDCASERPSSPPSDFGEYRIRLERLAEEKGAQYLHDMLREVDSASAEAIHPNNRKRVIRALEFFHLTGEPISRHNEREREKEPAYNACYFVLNDRRERVYENIGMRVDEMLRRGLVAEVERLREMGCHRGMISMQGLGYKEILAYLDGELSLEEAVEIIKRDTRHFAKRQLTWFRREKEVIWVDKESFGCDEERILEYMLQELRTKGIAASAPEAPSIYLFSGPCGCGKSTLTNAWAKKLVNEGRRRQVYVIHGDDFHAGFVETDYKGDFLEGGKSADVLAWEEILKFNWECILDTAGRALSRGLDVAVDYVVEEELPLMRRLAERYRAKLYYVVLTAGEEAIRQRIAGRGDVEMTERALFLKDELEHRPENQGYLFDTTGKTLERELEELEIERFLLQEPGHRVEPQE